MRIGEISSQNLWRKKGAPTADDDHHLDPVFSQIESLVTQISNASSQSSIAGTAPGDLRQALGHLSQLAPFSNSVKLLIWKLSYRLWNGCVDISNAISTSRSSSHPSLVQFHAELRQISADMLSLAGEIDGVPSPAIKSASFYLKTGQIWHDQGNFDLSSTCFEKATDILSKIDISAVSDAGERRMLLDLHISRSRTAWEMSERNLAITLLNRGKTMLFGYSEHYKLLANQYLAFSKRLLSNSESSAVSQALKLMNEALDLCEKGVGSARSQPQAIQLKELRSKALRFIAAVHLQKGEYESVIKCIRVLRTAGGEGDDGDHHACLPVLAMKAWLGLGKHAEAEKELKGMMANKDIPEGVWVSAVESYFESVGTAGAETAKGVFLGLLGRCHVSAGAAVRLAYRVSGNGFGSGDGSTERAKVVADLVSDVRVMELFSGEAASKDRAAMHAVLWNYGSDHFRSKDYQTSADLFEKSLLYVPRDVDSRILRAKGFRVLSLCHIGLCQLDRAQEYIDEAEKLDSNTACAFLKYKIYLQQSAHASCINQILVMKSCLDFTPDFLFLAAHEAIACRALPVAVDSLSELLNFYTSGKVMATAEVAVLRTLITVLSQDRGSEPEILKFMKRARARASELGAESFFGSGEVGKREQNWFSISSWNFGINCGKKKDYELCAEFMTLVSEFHGFFVDGQLEEANVMVCRSLILTLSALLAASETQSNTTLKGSELKHAVELLDKAGKMLKFISAGTETDSDASAIVDPDLFFMYTFNAYDIYGRLNSGTQQLLCVKNFVSSKACNSKHLLQLGLDASHGPRSNPDVAMFALDQCLSAILSSTFPDYHDVATVIRTQITVMSIQNCVSSNDLLHDVYRQAYGIMVGLKDGEYPTEEGKWLATTAWNRAAIPVRLGQVEAAKRWMSIGLELAHKVPGMDSYRASMEAFMAAFEK